MHGQVAQTTRHRFCQNWRVRALLGTRPEADDVELHHTNPKRRHVPSRVPGECGNCVLNWKLKTADGDRTDQRALAVVTQCLVCLVRDNTPQ